MSPNAKFEIRDPKAEDALKRLAALIKHITASLDTSDEQWGFLAMLFTFGPDGKLFYISDGVRGDTIRLIKEWLANQEGAYGSGKTKV